MSLLEILKLVGFATGAVLHLYISWLIWRKPKYRSSVSPLTQASEPAQSRPPIPDSHGLHGLNQSERTFILVGLCLGGWFLGNLLGMFQALILGPERLTGLLRIWDTIAVIGIALFPSCLLHSHLAFWSWMDSYRRITPQRVSKLALLFYVPMVVLPYTIYRVNTGVYKPYLSKLGVLLLPYSIWFALALWSAAGFDWAMRDRLYRRAVRERTFLGILAALLFLTGAAQLSLQGLGRTNLNDYLWVGYVLLSLLPTFTIAYYVYRYNLYELAIKRSLVYATFAVLFLTVYTYGVRHLDAFLVSRFDARPGVIEALLMLGMVLAAGPMVRILDGIVRRLFRREVEIYRDVVRQVTAVSSRLFRTGDGSQLMPHETTGGLGEAENASEFASQIDDVSSLVAFVEQTMRKGLALAGVHILLVDRIQPGGPHSRLLEKMLKWQLDSIELDEDLDLIGASVAYAIRRDPNLVGLMIVESGPESLGADKRAVLDVLAGQVGIGIETCLLIEEKVGLERELAAREKLAVLGRMAATIAHEVKNPLSSIKSIAQVMREDLGLGDYGQDLDLIIGEIDRLSRTVSQLLAFSRPTGTLDIGGGSALSKIIVSTVGLLRGQAEESHVTLEARVAADAELSGLQAGAVREIVSNLLLNSIQAMPEGGKVLIETSANGHLPSQADTQNTLQSLPGIAISIVDDGPGIAAESQSSVFQPFYTTKPQGTGLGLAIVGKRVVELGGAIELTSPAGPSGGSRFTVTIPLN